MVATRPGDDPTPRAGEGGPRRTTAQLAADPAFTATYVRKSGETAAVDLSTAASVTLPVIEQVVIPPAAVAAAAVSASAWYAVNRTILMRFQLHRRGKFAGITLGIGAASGNVEACVYSVTRTGTGTFNLAKVATTGPIVCPTPSSGSAFVSFTSAATLDAGEYALGFWCDNTTATFAHSIFNAVQWAGWALNDGGASVGGAPATVTGTGAGGRVLVSTLEGSVPLG